MARRVSLLKSDQVSVPVVVGSLRPAIILPRSLAATASKPELVDAVLLHELSHIQRGDFGWNLVRRLTQSRATGPEFPTRRRCGPAATNR